MLKPFPIPVRADHAPSPANENAARHEEETARAFEMPRKVSAYAMPSVPDSARPETLEKAAAILSDFRDAITDFHYEINAQHVPRFDVLSLPPDVQKMMNEVLGEGDVSARVEYKNSAAQSWRNVYAQESVFTGIWRVREFNHQGLEIAHWVEASALPRVFIEVAQSAALPFVPEIAMPEGVMNAPSLLSEISAALKKVSDSIFSRKINLTLLPLSPADYEALLQALPVGVVAIVSRGFGSCRVTSTGIAHVWRVQHFNQKSALILNAIEVVLCPNEVLAASEDIEDALERLDDLISWMRECANNPV